MKAKVHILGLVTGQNLHAITNKKHAVKNMKTRVFLYAIVCVVCPVTEQERHQPKYIRNLHIFQFQSSRKLFTFPTCDFSEIAVL